MTPETSPEDDDRFGLAEDRTLLANERTFSAWLRTGLAALVAGVGFERFLGDILPAWAVRPISVLLILAAAASFYLGAWRYTHPGIRMRNRNVYRIALPLILALSTALIGAAMLAVAAMWIH